MTEDLYTHYMPLMTICIMGMSTGRSQDSICIVHATLCTFFTISKYRRPSSQIKSVSTVTSFSVVTNNSLGRWCREVPSK